MYIGRMNFQKKLKQTPKFVSFQKTKLFLKTHCAETAMRHTPDRVIIHCHTNNLKKKINCPKLLIKLSNLQGVSNLIAM